MIPGIVAGQMRQASGGGGDPYWSNVVSLLHFDGTDGSTVFTDQKGRTWSGNGSGCQITSAASKFGGASAVFTGAGWLSTPASGDFDFGTGDFTLECWVRPTTSTGIRMLIARQIDSPVGLALQLRLNGTSLEMVMRGISGGSVVTLTATGPVATGVFTHVAASRVGADVRLFVGGALGASGVCAFDLSVASSRGLILGAADGNSPGSSNRFSGYIDDLRVTKGVGRYAANFTPPTAPFPNG